MKKKGFEIVSSAITGVLATLFHDLIITPSDVIKQRMQLTGKIKCLECIRKIFKSEGLVSFYRSLPITFFMNAPYNVSTVIVNENLKKLIEPNKRKWKFSSYLLCGGLAGATSAVLTIPLDNIKTRLQTQETISSCEKHTENHIQGSNNHHHYHPKDFNLAHSHYSTQQKNECTIDSKIKYKDILSVARVLHQENGFFRGITPRLLFCAPSCAISWCSYEIMKNTLLSIKHRKKY